MLKRLTQGKFGGSSTKTRKKDYRKVSLSRWPQLKKVKIWCLPRRFSNYHGDGTKNLRTCQSTRHEPKPSLIFRWKTHRNSGEQHQVMCYTRKHCGNNTEYTWCTIKYYATYQIPLLQGNTVVTILHTRGTVHHQILCDISNTFVTRKHCGNISQYTWYGTPSNSV